MTTCIDIRERQAGAIAMRSSTCIRINEKTIGNCYATPIPLIGYSLKTSPAARAPAAAVVRGFGAMEFGAYIINSFHISPLSAAGETLTTATDPHHMQH